MTAKITKVVSTLILVGTISIGLSACNSGTPEPAKTTDSSTSTPIPIPTSIDEISSTVAGQNANSYIVGPITGSINDLIKAKKVRVPASSSLIIDKMDSSEHSQWTATSSNEKVAVFVPGVNGETASMIGTPPSFTVLSSGTSDIVLTNTSTGQTVKFTIEGIPVR